VANYGGHSWVLDQAEIATDVVFTTRPHLGAEWPDRGNISVADQQSDVHWHKRHIGAQPRSPPSVMSTLQEASVSGSTICPREESSSK